MKIQVRAKTNQRLVSIVPVSADDLIVSVKATPIDGRANKEIIKLLAKYYNVPQKEVRLVMGATSKNKVFDIPNIESAK